MVLLWHLLSGPYEAGYIYLLPQSSPLAQCSTATTYTIQSETRLHTSVPPWTDLGLVGVVGGVMPREPASLFPSGSGGIRTQNRQHERQALYTN